MDRPRRPAKPSTSRSTAEFQVGERCRAHWTGKHTFPATISSVLPKDKYEVIFDDGYVKVLPACKIVQRKSEKRNRNVQSAPRGVKRPKHAGRKRAKSSENDSKGSEKDEETIIDDDNKENSPDAEDPETEDVDHDWMVQWENGAPIGEPSTIEVNVGIRDSILVADPRLPKGWKKHFIQRRVGVSAGKWDCVIINPEQRKFRSKTDVSNYFSRKPDQPFEEWRFDFRSSSSRYKKKLSQVSDPADPTLPIVQPQEEIEIPDAEPPASEDTIPLSALNVSNLIKKRVDKIYECPREGCDEQFHRKRTLKKHLRNMHPSQGAPIVAQCDNIAPSSPSKKLEAPVVVQPVLPRVTLKDLLSVGATPKRPSKPTKRRISESFIENSTSKISPKKPPDELKPEAVKAAEIINCHCGLTEENGLMIQCDQCSCWEHASCNSIHKKSAVPENFVCFSCENPTGKRESMQHFHKQDWLKEGTLPSTSFRHQDERKTKRKREKMMKLNHLSGDMLKLRDAIHSISYKLNIAEVKDHPKLYLWAKTAKDQKTQTSADVPVNQEEGLFIPRPQPAINNFDCRQNLLYEIQKDGDMVQEQLDYITKVVDALEAEDAAKENSEAYAKTMQMLIRNMDTLQDFAKVSDSDLV